MALRIAVENSTWNNIGDGFYQESITNIIESVAPDADVVSFDGPITRAFKVSDTQRYNGRMFDSRRLVDADLYVLSGPILGAALHSDYGGLIESLHRRGLPYIILSAHGADKPELVRKNRELLEKFPPLAFSTRDDITFANYRGIAQMEWKGVCAAFFVGYVNRRYEVKSELPYILSSFYTEPDPYLTYPEINEDRFDPEKLKIKRRTLPVWKLSRHFQGMLAYQTSIHGHEIIRPVHDIAYKFPHLNFCAPGRYLSYNPICYLSLYSGASLVVSDRVHACAAGIAHGIPGILIGKFDRAALFETGNIVCKRGQVLYPNMEAIHQRYHEFSDFIRQIIGRLN